MLFRIPSRGSGAAMRLGSRSISITLSLCYLACLVMLLSPSDTSATDVAFSPHIDPSSSFASLFERDASTLMSGGKNSEGENHSPVEVPSGATFTSVPVGTGGEEIAAFWTRKAKKSQATQAFIMIHGRLRNGNEYWTTMDTVLNEAIGNKTQGADPNAIVVAPQFFSAHYNSGQYTKQQLAWGDVNAWQAGDPAIHPSSTRLTSFDALDALVAVFLDQSQYPAMQRVVVVGHGGGGQLIQRYATVAADPPAADAARVAIRYIHGDPSSCNYFTHDRVQSVDGDASAIPSKKSCAWYNTWRYGFDNFTGTADGLKSPQEYFTQYISRDVVSIVGYQDVKASGDNYCMAQIQGGTKRRDRNLIWWQYINTLARTGEDLRGFPGTFDTSKMPDWSGLTKTPNTFGVRLIVVADADHSAQEVFESDEGRAALFATGQLPTGWRPKGWRNTSKAVMPSRLYTTDSYSPNASSTNNDALAPPQKNATAQALVSRATQDVADMRRTLSITVVATTIALFALSIVL